MGKTLVMRLRTTKGKIVAIKHFHCTKSDFNYIRHIYNTKPDSEVTVYDVNGVESSIKVRELDVSSYREMQRLSGM